MRISLSGALIIFFILILSGVFSSYIILKKSKNSPEMVRAIWLLVFMWITINFLLLLFILLLHPS